MFRSILVPVDVEEQSSWRPVLPVAARMARDYDAQLHVLSVVPPFGSALVGGYFPKDYETRLVEARKHSLAEVANQVDFGDVEPKLHVSRGTIYEEILTTADRLGCDLIVLAAHRPELRDFLLGPNAARVVRHARQSVVVVRS